MTTGLHFGYRVLGISKAEWEKMNRAEELTQGQHFGPRVLSPEPLTAKQAAAMSLDPEWANKIVDGKPAAGATAPFVAPATDLDPADVALLEKRRLAVEQAQGFRALTVDAALELIRSIDSGLLLLLTGEHSAKGKPPRKRVLEALYTEAAKRGVELDPFAKALTAQKIALPEVEQAEAVTTIPAPDLVDEDDGDFRDRDED